MKPEARQKLEDRLQSARTSLARLVEIRDHPTKFVESDFRVDWHLFLVASNGIYTMIEQGTKATPGGREFVGHLKTERDSDPLLRYMREARNADEHGIAPTTGRRNGRLGFFSAGEELASLEDFDGRQGRWKAPDGRADFSRVTNMRLYPATPTLEPVKARDRTTIQPPLEHLSAALADRHPASVATHFLTYLERAAMQAIALN